MAPTTSKFHAPGRDLAQVGEDERVRAPPSCSEASRRPRSPPRRWPSRSAPHRVPASMRPRAARSNATRSPAGTRSADDLNRRSTPSREIPTPKTSKDEPGRRPRTAQPPVEGRLQQRLVAGHTQHGVGPVAYDRHVERVRRGDRAPSPPRRREPHTLPASSVVAAQPPGKGSPPTEARRRPSRRNAAFASITPGPQASGTQAVNAARGEPAPSTTQTAKVEPGRRMAVPGPAIEGGTTLRRGTRRLAFRGAHDGRVYRREPLT